MIPPVTTAAAAMASVETGNRKYFLTDEQLASCKFKLARQLMRQSGRLCLVDSNNLHQVVRYKLARWLGLSNESRGGLENEEAPQIKRLWPLAVLLVYLIISAKLVYRLALQFDYDRYSLKVEFYERQTALELADSNGSCANEHCMHYRGKLAAYSQLRQATRETIKAVGNPYVELRFFAQAALIIVLIIVGVCYALTQFVINHCGIRNGMFFVNLLLNERAEFQACQEIIKRTTSELLNSSANLLTFRLEFSMEATKHAAWYQTGEATGAATLVESAPVPVPIEHLQRQHLVLARFVRQMVAGRELLPPNRAAEWVEPMVDAYVKVNATNLLYSCLADYLCAYGLHQLFGRGLNIETAADRFSFVELAAYFLMSILPTSNYMGLIVTQDENQTRYICLISEQVLECARLGERDFVQLLSSRQHAGDELLTVDNDERNQLVVDAMNRRLVGVFLKYKIFLAQLAPALSPWSFIMVIQFLCMFSSPLFTRLYIPYIASGSGNLVLLLYSLSFIGFTNLALLPMCHFHSKGQRLLRDLYSLLAHTLDLNQQWRQLNGADRGKSPASLYTDHMVWLLHKELVHPDEVLARFSTQAFGFQATFPNVIEVQFYFSILILSLFFEISSWRKLLGDRLDDPFQIMGP